MYQHLFCRICSLLLGFFAKETYNFIDPTNQIHPISLYHGAVYRHVSCVFLFFGRWPSLQFVSCRWRVDCLDEHTMKKRRRDRCCSVCSAWHCVVEGVCGLSRAVCCSVLQCVAVCCSVLQWQCVALRCRGSVQFISGSVSHCVAVCCSVNICSLTWSRDLVDMLT